MRKLRIFYCHGMGGGEDSRIPAILKAHYASACYADADGGPCSVELFVRTYSFDPDTASAQIKAWVSEIRPDLVIGESLGANHAITITGVPHLYVSPAMNALRVFSRYSWAALVPGVRLYLNRKFKPSRPGRQKLNFRRSIMKRYGDLYRRGLECARKDYSFAFFGLYDHYIKQGIVDIPSWAANYGEYAVYPGSHYMEQEFIDSMLIPKIDEVLGIVRKA